MQAAMTAARPRSQDGRTRPKPARNIGGLPKHLPREDVVIEPAIDRCPCCQGTLHRIGKDVRENARHRAGDPAGQTHPRPPLRLPRLRRRRGAGRGTAATDRRRTADGRSAGAHRRGKIRLAPAAASPDPDAGGLRHQTGPLDPGALDRADCMVVAAALRVADRNREGGGQGVLRRHAAAGAGPHAAADTDRTALVLRRGWSALAGAGAAGGGLPLC